MDGEQAPQSLDSLLEPLIAGLGEDPPWQDFVHELRARLGGDYASITFRPFAGDMPAPRLSPTKGAPSKVIHIASGRESPEIVAQSYRDSLYYEDPLPYHDLVAGRVYALPELLRASDPAHEAWRRKLLVPSGMNLLRMMRVEVPGGVSAWLTVSREDCDFTPADDALVAALAPFLRAGLGAYMTMERERMAAAVAGAAISRLNFAWLTLDAAGVVLDSDVQGGELLAQGRILRRGPGGRLSARGQVGRAIAAAIAALAGQTPPLGRPRAIVLSREPWLDMLLVPAGPTPRTARPAPALVAYVHADSWSTQDRCEQLGQLFDLLPSEARLALALSRGMSITEAAGELGLTVESARTYSKRIYAKTGARGQADLVRFIHRSVLTIA
jgi:DNA-binding CsgD family transcriptional regulator